MPTPERLSRLHTGLRRGIELYITACFELAILAESINESRDYWDKEARRAEQNKNRMLHNIELMVTSAEGGYVPEIDGDVRRGGITINARGDAIVADVRDSTNVSVGKEIDQDVTGDK